MKQTKLFRQNQTESFGKLRERYSLSNNDFLKYLTMLHSIPTAWKLKIKNENFNIPIASTLISQIVKTNQTNQYIYRHILKKNRHRLTNQKKSGMTNLKIKI